MSLKKVTYFDKQQNQTSYLSIQTRRTVSKSTHPAAILCWFNSVVADMFLQTSLPNTETRVAII